MRIETITRTLYTFDDLTDEAKEKAINNLWDITVSFDWWENVYEDAEQIGLKITEFDIDRGSYLSGDVTDYTLNVAERILKEHGEMTETYKLAEQYMEDRKTRTNEILVEQCQGEADLLYWPGCLKDWETIIDYYPEEIEEDDYEELNVEFERALKEEYLSILRREYNYLTSEESIIETIQANEYEFLEDGTPA